MAAYAATVSLMYILDQIENHPSPPISLDKPQLHSLTHVVTFLQEFLEGYVSPYGYSDEADPLEVRIADAAHAVEDVIESHIVDTIHLAAAAATQDVDGGEETRSLDFFKSLQRVIEDMGLIMKEVAETVGEIIKAADEPQIQRGNNIASHGGAKITEMVGFDGVLLQLLDRLTGRDLNRRIIPITGMGGIGKTTLARNAFQSKLVKERFDVCLWATISQDHNIVQTLREVMNQVGGGTSSKGVNELGEELYKYLFGRRYLVIMDDMWSEEVWDKMKFFFPENNNGSRVIVTTRLSNLAVHLTDSNSILDMRFLDEVSSWDLFSKTVFGEGCFPVELERIGKQIVGNCKGLPLALVVIGGLMVKSQQTQEYWEYIEKNLSSIVNSESDGYCLRVLRLSYNHLPAYLKPCFLYMGVFEEDRTIIVSRLIKLWVSEGFLKPKNGKSLETVARECVNELVERNLIMVDELGSLGKIKYCKVHDLLRDLSLKEAQKQRFYYVLKENNSPRDMSSQRRFVIPRTTPEEEVVGASESMSGARSFISYRSVKQLPDFILLRTLYTCDENHGIEPSSNYTLEDVFGLVNSRYLYVCTDAMSQIPSSIKLLWNLHTLVVLSWREFTAPKEIWRMHRLKHVEFVNESVRLSYPPGSEDGNDIFVLENLQTLKGVKNFDLNAEVVRRIPNIKKLKINYDGEVIERVNCLSYLCYLSKLENLECITKIGGRGKYLEEMSFPRSLKKLSIQALDGIEFEIILSMIGSLPLLHTLFFIGGFFRTREWETVEGQFPSLSSLTLLPIVDPELDKCCDLEKWTMPEDSSFCFPLLEQLCLMGFERLEEIPSEVGELPKLKLIQLVWCSETAVVSAKRILEEQENLYGEGQGLHVKVRCDTEEQAQALQYLATPNFHVSIMPRGLKIGVGVRLGWEKRREKLMILDTCFYEWQNLIAETARKGFEGEESLQWDLYKILDKELQQQWLQSVEKRKSMPRLKGSKRAPKSAEYRTRVYSGLAKYHGIPEGAEWKPKRKPAGGDGQTRNKGLRNKNDNDDVAKRRTKIQNQQIRSKRSRAPSYKDPLASTKLEMLKNIRAQRAAVGDPKTEAVTKAKLLIAEAEKAAKALEVAAKMSPLAHASLMESRMLIAEAHKLIESIEIEDATAFIEDDNESELSEAVPPLENKQSLDLKKPKQSKWSSQHPD